MNANTLVIRLLVAFGLMHAPAYPDAPTITYDEPEPGQELGLENRTVYFPFADSPNHSIHVGTGTIRGGELDPIQRPWIVAGDNDTVTYVIYYMTARDADTAYISHVIRVSGPHDTSAVIDIPDREIPLRYTPGYFNGFNASKYRPDYSSGETDVE